MPNISINIPAKIKSFLTYVILPMVVILGISWFIDFVSHIEPLPPNPHPPNGTGIAIIGLAALFWLGAAISSWGSKGTWEDAPTDLLGGIAFVLGWSYIAFLVFAVVVGGCEWLPWTDAICKNWP